MLNGCKFYKIIFFSRFNLMVVMIEVGLYVFLFVKKSDLLLWFCILFNFFFSFIGTIICLSLFYLNYLFHSFSFFLIFLSLSFFSPIFYLIHECNELQTVVSFKDSSINKPLKRLFVVSQ